MTHYRMPAEWEPHEAMWIAWPHDEISFPGRLEQVKSAVAEAVAGLHVGERVELLVLDDAMAAQAAEHLQLLGTNLDKINFRRVDYLDGWMRDVGPIFVKDQAGKTALVKWIFNTWGNKFPDLLPDDRLPFAIRDWLRLPMMEPGLVLEGGAIEVDGQGICLTTEQCVLNENRNLGKTKHDVEEFLASYLGIKKTIWLFQGLINDHTDGHIDELARFAGPGKILCAYEEDPRDENYAILKNNFETLQQATDLEGRPFELVKLPMPHVTLNDPAAGLPAGARAPASYANFLIGNRAVLASVFGDPNDGKALEILGECFPGRKIIPINCREVIYGGGAIHCMTQQQPA